MRQEVKRSVPKARSRREAMRYGSHASTEQERRSGLRSGSAPKQRPRGTGPPRPAPGQPRQPGTGHSCRGGPRRHRQVRRARRRLRPREQAPWGRRTLKQPGLEAGPGLCNRSRRTRRKAREPGGGQPRPPLDFWDTGSHAPLSTLHLGPGDSADSDACSAPRGQGARQAARRTGHHTGNMSCSHVTPWVCFG